MKPYLICFIGIDGSGKTPHASRLVRSLRGAGMKCDYVWGRWTPIALKPVQVIFKKFYLRARRIDAEVRDEYTTQAKQRVLRNRNVANIWKYLVFLDYGVQIALKVRLALLLGRMIVCDRYVYDTLVDLAVDLGLPPNAAERFLADPLLRSFPKPDLIFVMDVPEDVACARKGDRGLMDYLRERRQRYLALAAPLRAAVLDGCDTFSNVQQLIMRTVLILLAKESLSHGS